MKLKWEGLNPNRNTGKWLPDVVNCARRVLPCGNTFCADEAMRSVEIAESAPHASRHARKHAFDIASDCVRDGVDLCPMQEVSGTASPVEAVTKFIDYLPKI